MLSFIAGARAPFALRSAVAQALAVLAGLCLLLLPFSTANAQSAGEIQAHIEDQVGKPLGILGPLPLSAGRVNVAAKGSDFAVLLGDLSYGSVDLGALEFTMTPVGGGIYLVDGVAFSGGDSYRFDRWAWDGIWDMNGETYIELNYGAKNLSITSDTATHSVGAFDLLVASAATGNDFGAVWDLSISDLLSSAKTDQGWTIAIDRFASRTTSSGMAEIDEYGQSARLIAGLATLREAGESTVRNPGSILTQLPQLLGTGQGLMAEQLSPVQSAQSALSISGVSATFPAFDLAMTIDSVSMDSSTQPEPDGSLSMDTLVQGKALNISRREDTASIQSGQLAITLGAFDLTAFYDAAKSLFGEPQPGDTWAFLSDLIAFYQDFEVTGSLENTAITLPDRDVALTLDQASGTFALADMKQDGASVTLGGDWRGLDIFNTGEVPAGVTPEPLVLYGRVLRFDPLTTALIPRQGQGTFVIGGLPLGQVRQTLAIQPHTAPLYDTGAVAREAMTAGLVLMTPFLITPPTAELKDTQVLGDAYRLDASANLTINPIVRPFFGFGTSTVEFTGADKLTDLADMIMTQQAAAGDNTDEDLVDWAARIKDTWLARLGRYAGESGDDASQYRYDIQATQMGQVTVNNQLVFGQQ